MTEPRPEDLYCKAETAAERLRLRTAVWVAYGAHVRAAARRLAIPLKHMDDACQAGVVGLLDALERYEPGRIGPDRGVAFWAFAAHHVRNAIQVFRRTGIEWAPPPDRGQGERAVKRAGANERLKAARRFESLDEETRRDDENLNPEILLSEAQRHRQLSDWAAQLSPSDRDLIFSEDGRQSHSRHYQTLVKRARAHVTAPPRPRGKDDAARAVRRDPDTLRP